MNKILFLRTIFFITLSMLTLTLYSCGCSDCIACNGDGKMKTDILGDKLIECVDCGGDGCCSDKKGGLCSKQ